MEYKANEAMDFAGASNVRELGGYVNRDGIRLKEHRLLRGGDLSRMTQEDLERLYVYGIHTSIDLRKETEKEGASDPFEAGGRWNYHAIPIRGKVDLRDPKEMLYKLYQSFLDDFAQEFRKEFQVIAEAEDGVIFHCTAGKDRTGVTAMLILALCDVCEEQIIADYAASAANNREQTKRQLAQLEESGLSNIPLEIFESKSGTMKKTLAYLNQRYGGARNYLQTIGIKEAEMEAIRRKLLD